VMFVVQRLEPHFTQASKTSIGHVVQLLYRASCFKVFILFVLCYSLSIGPPALKGQYHEIFDFRFFKNLFLSNPEYTIRAVTNFFKNS
jgi:hypothetical protein